MAAVQAATLLPHVCGGSLCPSADAQEGE